MANTTPSPSAATTRAAPSADNDPSEAESFDLCPGLADLFSDINDTVLAIRELLESADPTDLTVVLLDTLRLTSLRCEIGHKLAGRTDTGYTPTDIKGERPARPT